jgi:hypothetical protein
MPGTETCLKVGGFVRAEANINASGSFAQYNSINFDNRDADREVTRARAGVSLDARSQTEYGTLRSYMILAMQADNSTGTTGGGAGGSGVGTWSNRMFIQWAGFTAGLVDSFFDFDTFNYSNQTNKLGSSISGAGILAFAYTAQFGNGLSATISAEDTEARRSAILGTGDGYAGRRWPDVVANLRIDQAWGSAQIMGAIHNVNAGYYVATTPGGNPPPGEAHPSDEIGWAVGAGLKLNAPMLGKGDYVIAQVNYSKGAINYIANGFTADYNIRTGSGIGLMTAYGPIYDSTYALGTDQDLTEAWSVTAGYEHRWNPQWKTSIYGA